MTGVFEMCHVNSLGITVLIVPFLICKDRTGLSGFLIRVPLFEDVQLHLSLGALKAAHALILRRKNSCPNTVIFLSDVYLVIEWYLEAVIKGVQLLSLKRLVLLLFRTEKLKYSVCVIHLVGLNQVLVSSKVRIPIGVMEIGLHYWLVTV